MSHASRDATHRRTVEETVLFGRYRLVEPAGTGATAEVWRAVDERTGDTVALKRLHPIVFATDSGRRRLRREFRAVSGLRHPNVVRVRDLRIDRDDAAIVMEFVPGQSLRARLDAGPPFAPRDAVAIASDVAAALSAAHEAGIVHRDVTPGNILLAPNGGARLTDFGIASDGADETAVTATGTLVGTLRYLAPEQLRGQPATPGSDLHALGAVTYELLAGRPAFAATTPVGLVEEQRGGPAPIPGIPPALDRAVRTAMSDDPADRQPSVEAFAAEIRHALPDLAATEVVPLPVVTPTAPSPAGAPGIAAIWAGAAPIEAGGAAPSPRPSGASRAHGRLAAAPLAAVAAAAFGALIVAAMALGGPADPATGRGDPTATPRITAAPTRTATTTPAPAKVVSDRAKGHDHGKKGKGKDDH